MTSEQNKRTIEKILDAYFSDTLPLDVELDILSWIMYGGHGAEKDIKFEQLWRDIVKYEKHPANEKKLLESLAILKERLGLPPVETLPAPRKKPARRIMLRVAAVVAPLLVLGGALLYLGRGGDVAAEVPVIVASAESTLEIVLPDSSRVWLDKGATLTYPEVFDGERTMTLEGKAYFKVQRDESRPFVVNTEALAVRVLGTEFTVSASASDAETVVTLTSGKVEVNISGEAHVMERRARLTHNRERNEVRHEEIVAGESADWRSMNFEYIELSNILNAISERYNIVIEHDSASLAGEMVTLRTEGGETLDVVLSRLSDITGRFDYRIENEKVIIDIK